jgi:TolA-binding protein
MVKIKNVRRPAPQAGSPGDSGAGPRAVRKSRRRGPSASGLAIGILGWIAAAILVVMTALSITRERRQTDAIRAELPKRIEALQTAVPEREKQIAQEKRVLPDQINDKIKRQEALILEIKGLELTIQELEPQVRTLERTQKKLEESVAGMREDSGLTGEGVEALQARIDALVKKNDALKQEYKKRFLAMKAEFDERRARPEPEMMRQFYGSHRHTVFAPAAGFEAAEKLYSRKRSTDALRIYEDVVKRFPTSKYAEYAQARIAQIQGGVGYEPLEPAPSFEPYHPPDSAE